MYKGWFQVAFEREARGELTPAILGSKRLVLVRRDGGLRAYDATCPHRGAHLAFGGRLRENAIVCPFHGYLIRLGLDPGHRFSVPEFPVATIAGMVFVQVLPGHDNGWMSYLEELDRTNFIINGFEMCVRAPMETVIENAFDPRHFHAVHGVRTDEFVVRTSKTGALTVASTFYIPTRSADGTYSVATTPYRAVVPSPGLSAVALHGPAPYTIVTGATDTANLGECVVRLSVAYPKSAWRTAPTAREFESLLEYSRRGLEEDRLVWENLAPHSSPQWMPEDAAIREFHRFCAALADG
jgi:phenylpropionate dioxygenase-like ring-hydroxylating dioxygenase large terminal subunit